MENRLLVISFLLFAFMAKPFSGLPDDNEANKPVLDSDGQNVVTTAEYFLSPAFTGPGGGLSLFDGRNTTCPLIDVIQEQVEMLKGLPVKFLYAAAKEEATVYSSTDVNIKFSAADTLCSQETVWKVNAYDNSTGRWFITNDGISGNPGAGTLETWFKIEKLGLNVYKLTHCPSVCESCVTLCSAVGLYTVDGVRRLALSHSPLAFMLFRKNFNATN